MNSRLVRVLSLALVTFHAHAFQTNWHLSRKSSVRYPSSRAAVAAPDLSAYAFPSFVPSEVEAIEDPAALTMLSKLQRIAVPTPGCPDGVPTSYYSRRPLPGAAASEAESTAPPSDSATAAAAVKPAVVLIHGFDSSSLEFRRVVPVLEAMHGIDPIAVDILGWGFTDARTSATTSAEAKREHLRAFLKLAVAPGQPLVLVGASLGGAIALDFAAAYPDDVSKLVLIDAQGFIDGAGPMGGFPEPLARLGVKVLGSGNLRQIANKMSYFDKEKFATQDAMRVGRLPVLCEGWEDANLNYMCTGGFTPSVLVPKVTTPALVLWGANDEVLDPKLYAQRFVDEMPDARLTMIPECGHVPHLEKPEMIAKAIAEFVV